jgi:hypothetical protein
MGVDDDTPPWLRSYHDVQVDLHGLHDFANGVDGAADKNFAPRTTQLQTDYASGVQFGWNNPSGQVDAAKRKYHAALTVITQQIEAYIEASKILADAARRAAQRYGDADAMSAAKSKDIEGILGHAVADARKRQEDQQAAAAAAAAARHHGGRDFE